MFATQSYWNNLIKKIAAISALLITLSLWIAPPSQWFVRLFYEVSIERILFLILVYWVLLQIRDLEGEVLHLSYIIAIFALSLFYKWQTSAPFFTLGGLFPLSDALGYYNDAQNIIHGLEISGLGLYRPVFTAFLSTLLYISGNNLQYATAAFVLMNAIAVFLCAREIRYAFQSNLASAVFTVLSYLYYKRFSGTLMSENLGFCLGLMALYFFIKAARHGQIKHLYFGLILLTVALNARAGAFFTLPIIALWSGKFTPENKMSINKVWRAFLIIFIAMAACIGIPKLYSAPGGTHSNYADNLYGLAMGNKGYEQSFRDHPGATKAEVFKFAFEQIRSNPAIFISGIFGAYRDYFDAAFGANSFLLLKHDRGDLTNMVLWAGAFAGLIAGAIHRDRKVFFASLVFFGGILLSIGLVPPADSVRMRVYAATIPLSIYIIVSGIAFIQSQFQKNTVLANQAELKSSAALSTLFSGTLLFSALIAPVFIKSIGVLPKIESALNCNYGFEKQTIIIGQSSSLQLLPGYGDSIPPHIYKVEFDRGISRPDQQFSEEEIQYLLDLQPNAALTLASHYNNGPMSATALSSGIFVMDHATAPGAYSGCVKIDHMNVIHVADSGDFTRLTPSTDITDHSKILLSQLRKILFYSSLCAMLLLFSGFFNLSSPRRYWSIICWLFMSLGMTILGHVSGWTPLFWENRTLDPGQFRNPSGFLYRINLENDDFSDTLYWDFPSRLYENGFILYPAHESQSLIDQHGRGGYILKGNFLYFSSSDNSDPRNNGKIYKLETPGTIRLRYQIPAYLFALAGLLFWVYLIKPKSIAE